MDESCVVKDTIGRWGGQKVIYLLAYAESP
jgi:hypothetical protein